VSLRGSADQQRGGSELNGYRVSERSALLPWLPLLYVHRQLWIQQLTAECRAEVIRSGVQCWKSWSVAVNEVLKRAAAAPPRDTTVAGVHRARVLLFVCSVKTAGYLFTDNAQYVLVTK